LHEVYLDVIDLVRPFGGGDFMAYRNKHTYRYGEHDPLAEPGHFRIVRRGEDASARLQQTAGERAGDWSRTGPASDLLGLIRSYPFATLCAGLAAGFFVGQCLTSNLPRAFARDFGASVRSPEGLW
jgi:hypothetical protein